MIYNSDKSGCVVLDTVSNYLDGMKEHYMKDPVVNFSDVRNGEKEINNHVKMWSKSFNIGGSTNGR